LSADFKFTVTTAAHVRISTTMGKKECIMPEEIRRVEHYSASIPNKVGEGARVLGALREAGVNLIAFWGYPSAKGARLDFIPEDGEVFIAAAKKTKLRVRKSIAFYVHGDDRPGAVADILKKLADARISLGAMQAVCGGAGTYGGVISLAPAAARKAAKVLGAA
jgi:hypothetical protein